MELEAVRRLAESLWDAAAVTAVQQFLGSAWLPLFVVITQLGSLQGALLIVALLLWFRSRPLAYGLLGAIVIGATVTWLLKTTYYVPRPPDAQIAMYEAEPTSSFPSGHSVTAATLWGTLAAWRRVSASLAALVIPSVMLSRVYLGVHFPGDVLAGAVIGLAVVAAYVRVFPRVPIDLDRQPAWRSVIAVATLAFLGVVLRDPAHNLALLGAVAGLAVALPVELRYVRFVPSPVPLRWQIVKASVGLGVLLAFLAIAERIGDANPALGPLFFLAVLWVLLIAPALYQRLGLSAPRQ